MTKCLRNFSSSEPLFYICQYFPNSPLCTCIAFKWKTASSEENHPRTWNFSSSHSRLRACEWKHGHKAYHAECFGPKRNTHTHTHTHTRGCVYTCPHKNRHTCTQVCTQIMSADKAHTHTHVHAYTHAHIHTSTYRHTGAHTHSTSMIWRCREDSELRSPSESPSREAMPTVRSRPGLSWARA